MSIPQRDGRALQSMLEQGWRIGRNDLDRIIIPFSTKRGTENVGPITITRSIRVDKPLDNVFIDFSVMSAGEMERPGG